MDDKSDGDKKREQSNTHDSFNDWKSLDLGGLKSGAKDWKNNEAIDEMIDERYKD